jgi:hypothetical protein
MGEYFSDVPRKNLSLLIWQIFKETAWFIKESQPKYKDQEICSGLQDILDIQDEKSISVITITKYFQMRMFLSL